MHAPYWLWQASELPSAYAPVEPDARIAKADARNSIFVFIEALPICSKPQPAICPAVPAFALDSCFDG
jgi:hypothetical protein